MGKIEWWIGDLYDRCPWPLLPFLMLLTLAACLIAPGLAALAVVGAIKLAALL